MILKDKIGKLVLNKKNEQGTIVEVGDYIKVDFGNRTAQFQLDAFINGFLKFVDANLQLEVDNAINEAEIEKARIAEEKRIAAEKAEEERKQKAAEEAAAATSTKNKKPVKIDDLFGKDYHVEYLRRTPILTYQEVEKQFGIKISGFGRGINITDDSVVLISSMAKKDGQFVYHDHWTEDGDYIYSGEGKTGDQTLTKGNKAIVDAKKDGKTIYLFVKLSPSEYYFQGPVELVDYTYEDDQDENGNVRKEYKFRLRKIEENIERYDDNENDVDYSNSHIYLEWVRGFHSFDLVDKHESHFVINDRNCTITYTANRIECGSVSKTINETNFRRLINLFVRYYSILSDETRTSYEIFPFGGVGSYKYGFNGKSNLIGAPSLFKDDNEILVNQAYAEYNKIINDIFKQ